MIYGPITYTFQKTAIYDRLSPVARHFLEIARVSQWRIARSAFGANLAWFYFQVPHACNVLGLYSSTTLRM